MSTGHKMSSERNLNDKKFWNISPEYLQQRREDSARYIEDLYKKEPHRFTICEQCKGPQLRGAVCHRCNLYVDESVNYVLNEISSKSNKSGK